MKPIFYTYLYLDPRKPGNFNYGIYHFDYEPFYVGKGHNNRCLKHLKDSRKSYKVNKIKKILSESLEPIIIKYQENLLECQALKLEIDLIKTIGRLDLKTGTLTNLTDGGQGTSGNIPTEETKYKNGSALRGKKIKFTQEHIDKFKGKHSEQRVKINKLAQLNYASQYDYKNPMKNKFHSEETKQKMKENRKGKCLGKNNISSKPIIINGKKYVSRKEAYTDLGITKSIFYSRYIKEN